MCRLFLFLFLVLNAGAQTQFNAAFVNPMIGTGGHGHTFPGAVLPFGMVQLSPDTRVDGSWDGCSGYHYSDKLIYGFSHTHLSGTGCSDWGDVLLMPMSTNPVFDPKIYASKFQHIKEKATAGYYEVFLEDEKVQARLTATKRVGIHHYSFPLQPEHHVILDLLHRDKTLSCDLKIIDSVTVQGHRISQAWAPEQHVYFVIKFSKPFIRFKLSAGRRKDVKVKEGKDEADGAVFSFNGRDGKPLLVKVAISGVSSQGALKNLEAEAMDWDFVSYQKKAFDAWSTQLQKIEITEPDPNKRSIFYSALYHCFIHPSLNMDVDSSYRGRDNAIHQAKGFTNYSVFSLWDTYRGLHPLFTMLEQKRTKDFINSFLAQYQQSGRLPMWELSGNETDCMIAFHSVSVIADAYVKGIRGFDSLLAYKAMKAASEYTQFGIPLFNRNGFLGVDDENESVSKTLEYGYDNWCIGQMAGQLGFKDEKIKFEKRSLAYRNLFDGTFMKPKKNGCWIYPFYPAEINNHFTEGNSWQYSFYVPHDLGNLQTYYGGPEFFERKLDEAFTTKDKNTGRHQADVTGLIGQYAHGNEPSHHLAYLYSYIGKPQKSFDMVSRICKDFYKNSPDGLIGNEDCGQMSAWYVLSCLGFYPVCPGKPEYVAAAPQFNRIKLNLENGKNLEILKEGTGTFLESIVLNSERLQYPILKHQALCEGGQLKFGFGAAGIFSSEALHRRSALEIPYVAAPLLVGDEQVFTDRTTVYFNTLRTTNYKLTYTTDGSDPVRSSSIAPEFLVIDSNCTIKARLYEWGDSSSVVEAKFYKMKYSYSIKMTHSLDPQYCADGVLSLLDGMPVDANWKKGNWLGIQGKDFECVIDLNAVKPISSVALSCLQDSRSWIIFPKLVELWVSEDGKVYKPAGSAKSPVPAQDEQVQVYDYTIELRQPVKAKYLKITARQFGTLPAWHQGQGGQSYIFAAELHVK